MDNAILEKIKQSAIETINAWYGYCGVAEGDHMAHISVSDGTRTLTITIKEEEETPEAPTT